MKFAQYLVECGTDRVTVAKQLDITLAYVGQLANRKSTPSLKLAVAIYKWSAGAVSFLGWFE